MNGGPLLCRVVLTTVLGRVLSHGHTVFLHFRLGYKHEVSVFLKRCAR